MPVELYQFIASPPCRMVRLLAEHLGIGLDIKDVDVTNFEADFIQNFYCASKINPQHTIPTMIDDGLILTESRAILMYLAKKYGDESLYPTDPDKRAVVDMRLCFDLGTLYVRFSETYVPVMHHKIPLDLAKLEKLDETLGYVENFLSRNVFIAGENLTISDFSMTCILSTLDACGHDLSNFNEITAYQEKCASLMKGWEDINLAGARMFGQWFKAALAEVETQ